MKKILIIMAAFGVLSLSACSAQKAANNPATIPTPQKTQATTNAESNLISIQNFAFSPAELTVKKGTTVTWTNNDTAPHQIKSATFNSDRLSQGQAFSFTFNNPGNFAYSCSIHPSMTGTIIVE